MSASANAPEAAATRDDIDELKRRREAAELRSQIKALSAPWWRKASLVTAVTGLLAAIIPVTTAIQQHYRTRLELSLQQAKQDNDIRIAYLDRYQLPGHRLRTLRFLVGTSADARLVSWARSEIPVVEAELADIDKRLHETELQLAQLPPGKTKEEVQKEIDDLKNRKDVSSAMAPRYATEPNVMMGGTLATPTSIPMTIIVPAPARVEQAPPKDAKDTSPR